MIINEIQTNAYYCQDINEDTLRVLVNLGVLVHVQTSVSPVSINRYFAKPEDAHKFRLVDYRTSEHANRYPVDPALLAQITPEERYSVSDYSA